MDIKKKITNPNKIIAVTMQIVAAVLFVAGFLVPPRGVIDPSVLTAGGILVAGASLFLVWDRAEEGADAQFKHGNTEININND